MWEIINNFLAVIGLISLIVTAIRVVWTFSGGSEWIDNVRIEEYPLDKDLEEMVSIYPQYFPEPCNNEIEDYATQNLFIPESTIIRNAKLKKIDEETIASGKCKYKKIKTFKMITPQNPLCLTVFRGEAIPRYMIEWTVEYGGKARYYFYDNMRNGYNNRSGFEYHYGFIAKIRKILDLK